MNTRSAPMLIAFKVVSLHPDLATNHRRVAGALLDSFNQKTGQCDPGLDRIARLLGVNRRTVIRAMPKLEAIGLFRKVRHGGYSHRNHYEPQWSRFLELEAQWKNRFEEASRARRTKLSPSQSQQSHPERDACVTQTFLKNQSNSTSEEKRLSRKEYCETVQLPSSSTYSKRATIPSSREVARHAAERRWSNDLLERYGRMPGRHAALLDGIDDILREAATDAEINKSGSGLSLILKALGGATTRNAKDLHASLHWREDDQ